MFKKSKDVTVSCLADTPCTYVGPTPEWSGPETPLSSNSNPLASLFCALFQEASKRDSKTIKLELGAGQIATHIKSSDEWVTMPGQRDDLWTPILFMLPRISSIESCQGTIKDPVSEDEWQFNFTKESNQIILSKI